MFFGGMLLCLQLIGEETSAENGTPVLTDAPTWVVDPLDGTTNFVHKFPFVCVSIGLVINKVPVVGVVYNPIMGELFTAVQGKGAHLNGQRIRGMSNLQFALVHAAIINKYLVCRK